MPEKCTEPCSDLMRLEQQMKDLTEQNSGDHKEIRERLAEVEKADAVQGVQYSTILEKLDGQAGKLDALSARIAALEAKPAKRWESLAEKAVWAVAAAVIAFLLARIGL